MADPMESIKQTFFAECDELLESLIDALQCAARGAADEETVNAAFRAVHSIKGGASAFGMDGIVEFAHRFENALDVCRAAPGALTAERATAFLKCSDGLADLIAAERLGQRLDPARLVRLIDAMETVTDADPEIVFEPLETVAAEPWTWRLSFVPTKAHYDAGGEPLALLRALGDQADIEPRLTVSPVEDLDELRDRSGTLAFDVLLSGEAEREVIEAIVNRAEGLSGVELTEIGAHKDSVPEKVAKPPSPPRPTVRVDLSRIDRLVNLVGELVINQSMLAQSLGIRASVAGSAIESRLSECQQLTRELQDSVINIRAQPIKALFQRMSRIVREAADTLGKEVDLHVSGELTEFDSTAIERLAEPLTHIVRNAIDHGLESPSERQAAGKPTCGRISLSAAQNGDQIVIKLADDGRGIDRQAVLAKARRQGLVPGTADLSLAEIDNLLFLPGITTRDAAGEFSGRGVGLDVVRAQIAALGGRATIASTPGQGTEITLLLPLTLALLDGLVVRVANEPIVLPMSAVSETLLLADRASIEMSRGQTAIRLHDSFYPLVDLGHTLGFRRPAASYETSAAVIMQPDDGPPAAFVVDSVEERLQVVIKRFDTSFGTSRALTAATILGDGQVALILDPAALAALAGMRNRLEVAS